ncbi:MAG: FAD-binding oxidoreductase, partial [Ktedonobacteraceae bacterium]|nr:FAD-binding oxidoreductase [Ktedonobacteraceae bacterium]
YDQARQTWDVKTFDQHPAMIILPASTSDVQTAVTFARAHHLPIGVQGGGHGHPYPVNNALLVNFANMTRIQIDTDAVAARVEPGAVFKALVQSAHADGLAPLNGFAASVGVVGYLLGGGIGWLARQYGPGAASIRSVELVAADGNLLHVSESSYPDLLWGLRGGGGNFGIVTSLECALYPVKDIFAGQVVYPIEQGKNVLSAYLKWTETVPDELTSALRMTHFPTSPDLPPPLRGTSAIVIMACYNGEDEQGKALLAPMRTLGNPLLDTFAHIPYSKVATISNDPENAAPLFLYNESGAFATFASKDVDALVDIAGNRDSGIFQAEIRHLGGALARQPEDVMAFNCRNANWYLNVQATAPSPDQLTRGKHSIATLKQCLLSEMLGETLINFLDAGNVGPYLTRIAYTPNNYQRLRELKQRYDATNVFRFNHNIPSS